MPERYINKKEENSMSAIEIKKVESRRDLRTFIEFHYDLYEGNPYDAPNLYTDEVNTLRKDKNAAFDFCEAEYFIAYRDGKVVGRVAAIINNSANEKWQIKAVRFGWIDFVDDIEVSTALLKAVEDYGRSKGMTEIVGPLGFTDMDPEGMLIKGFEELGTQATAYNYAYYPEHMERMGGWVKDNDYVEYKLYVPEKMPEKYAKVAEMIQKRYNLHIKKLKKDEIFGENGYGQRIFDVINATFKDLYGYSTLTQRQIDQYVKMYLPMIDLSLVSLIEGDVQGAERQIAKASGSENVTSAIAALNIAKGNYAQAEKDFENVNSNTAALAQLLNKNYDAAAKTLDRVENPNAMTDYLHAVVAARRGNKFAASSYLKEALQKDPSLKQYAENDLELQLLK